MRVIVVRVQRAICKVDGITTGQIEKGFLLLVGFKNGDDSLVLPKMVKKVSGLRIFEDENNKLNKGLKEVNGDILSISQFTLYADMKNGNRPSFTNAMPGSMAKLLYDEFNKNLEDLGFKVEKGIFGADMKLEYINDGPCTIILDSDCL